MSDDPKDPKLAACVDSTSGKLFPRTKEEWGRAHAGDGWPIPDHVWTCDGGFVDFTEKEPVDWSKKPRISFFSQPYGDGGSSTTGFFVAGGDQDRLDRACRELGIPSGSILSDDDMRRVFAYFGCKTAW